MPDVRLDRPDQAGARASAPEDASESGGFDRIADRRAGAMRLDIGHAGRLDAAVAIRLGEHRRLPVNARHRHRRRVPILVDRHAADQRIDALAGGECIGEPRDVNDARPFGPHESVGTCVEREALAGWERPSTLC